MALDEKEMLFQEEQIPGLAEGAFRQAYLQALAAGSSVLKVEGDAIIEVFPDGTKKFVKRITPPTPVTPGQKLVIR